MLCQEFNDEMILNLGSSVGIGAVMFAISLIALKLYARQRTKLLLYFFLSWTWFAIFIITNGVSIVIGNTMLFQISYIFFLPGCIIFWFAFIDDTMHEDAGIKKTVVAFILSTLLAAFVILEPWAHDPIALTFKINPELDWWFFQITNVVFFSICISYAYWATVTFKKSPPALKKYSTRLFMLGIIMLVAGFLGFIAVTGDQDVDTLLLLVQSGLAVVVTLGTIIIIGKEPRIAHLLPYTVYRLVITSRNGPNYYSKSWADADIDEDMLAGIMSAIRTSVKGTIGKAIGAGSISEIKMLNAVVLTEMRYEPVTIMLIASKASTALKTALDGFSSMFVKKFYDALYSVDGFPLDVINACETFTGEIMEPAIASFFGNIPSFFEHAIDDPIANAMEESCKATGDTR